MARLLICLLLLSCTFVSMAQQSAGILNTNGLKTTEDGYLVIESDPHLALRLGSELVNLSQDGRQLLLNLTVINPDSSPQTLTGDLFYINVAGATKGFNSFQRLTFELPGDTSNGVRFNLPESLSLLPSSALRFDINDCDRCVINRSTGNLSDAAEATITSAALGKIDIPEQGLKLRLDGWVLNDIEGDVDAFTISGGDPYLISPSILAKTENLGGLELILSVENPEQEIQDFQLFYATEKHGFIESASSIARSKVIDNKVRLFLPLHFLHQDFPPLDLLERVRLDFAHHGVRSEPSNVSGRWRLESARLVSVDESEQVSRSAKNSRYANKPQRQSVQQIAANVLKKLMADKVFIIFYFLLIVMLLIWQLARLRGSRHE